MVTPFDIVSKCFQVLSAAGMQDIYKFSKPDGEEKSEYVVFNTLPVQNDTVQDSDLNVNCHVADIDEQMRIPNNKRLSALSKQVIDLLDNHQDSDSLFLLKWVSLEREENLSEHYVNLRFEVITLNT